MEQREEWFAQDSSFGWEEAGWKPPEIDARLAGWITAVSPVVAGRYLRGGLKLPQRRPTPPGTGPGWEERAVADVLSECLGSGMFDSAAEHIESVAMRVMPVPVGVLDEDDDEPRSMMFAPPIGERWRGAVAQTSERVSDLLRYGPSSRFTEGELVSGGATTSATVFGMPLAQKPDALWRYPDGTMEAVLVIGEPDAGEPPGPPSEDWRVLLTAAVSRASFGAIPEIHVIRVQAGVAQVIRPSDRHVTNSLHRLHKAVREAVNADPSRDGSEAARIVEEGFTYPLTHDAVAPLQRGDWPGGRTPNRPGNRRPRR